MCGSLWKDRLRVPAWTLAMILGAATVWAGEGPVEVRVAATNNFASTALFAGVDKGFFLQYGLDAKLKVLPTGPHMVKALQSGDADFAPTAVTNFPIAMERGLRVKSVVSMLGDATSPYLDTQMGIVIPPGSSIARLADLEGKRVGVSMGTTGDFYLRAALARNKVPVGRVALINVAPGNMLSMLQGGGVDAVVGWEPYLTMMLEKTSGARLLVRGGNYACFCAAVHAPVDLIEKSPDAVYRFVLGVAAAAQFVRKHPEEAADITARYVPGLDPDLARRTIRYAIYDSRFSKFTFQAWEDAVKFLVGQKKMKQPFPARDVYDTRFIARAMREHPELFADLKPIP